ncbi:MAG: LicD family protein [Clostridiales bacterium]|nr:LicD family protein [Clostridiales bacterium]
MNELKSLQLCELEILKEFIRICDKLKVKYYLLGGTLLGAVRHQGFIPWDDDIDVGMSREDYELFLKEGQKHLPEHYFLQTHHTDPEWPANFAKIRDSRTTFIESSVKNQQINHGVYIDVFPLDHFTSDEVKEKSFSRKNILMVRRISRVFTLPKENRKKPLYRRCALFLIDALSYVLYPTLQSALNARERLFKSIKTGGLLANHCGAWGKKEIMPAEWYGEGTELSFEGLAVRGPIEYKKWLTQVYGDYMQLPPIEKRIAHHYNEVIDLKKSYKEYC